MSRPSAAPNTTDRFMALCKPWGCVSSAVLHESAPPDLPERVRTMWSISDDGTVVGDSHGNLLHLSTFGPRVRMTKLHAPDSCEIRVQNKFSHRVAFRWRQMAGSSALKLSEFKGILRPHSGMPIECVGEPSCVKFEMIFAYVDKVFGASHADTADEFWGIMEKDSVMHLCFRKKITIRRAVKPDIDANAVPGKAMSESNASEKAPFQFVVEPKLFCSAPETEV